MSRQIEAPNQLHFSGCVFSPVEHRVQKSANGGGLRDRNECNEHLPTYTLLLSRRVANYIFSTSADYVTRCKIHTSYTHGYYVPVLPLLSLRHALSLQVGDGLVLGPLAVPQAGGDHGHAGGGGGVEEKGQRIPVHRGCLVLRTGEEESR